MAGSCGSRGIAGVECGVWGFSGIVADRPAGPGGGRGYPPVGPAHGGEGTPYLEKRREGG